MKAIIHKLIEHALRSKDYSQLRLSIDNLLLNYIPVNQLEYE